METPFSEFLEISAGCGAVLPAERYRPRPSERNLQIYEAVRLQGRTLGELAQEWGISQQRASQICRQVEAWRNATGPAPANKASAADRARIERQLIRRQLERMYVVAMNAADRSWEPIVIERSGVRGSTPWTETERREREPSLQWLKLAMRTAELIAELDARPAAPQSRQWLAKATAVADELHREPGASRTEFGRREKTSLTSRTSSNEEAALDLEAALAAIVHKVLTGVADGSCGEAGGAHQAPEGPPGER